MSNLTKIQINGTVYELGKPVDATLTLTGMPADASVAGRQFTQANRSLSDAFVNINTVIDKIKAVPFGRSGTAGELTVEYSEGKVKINGGATSTNILLEADADAIRVDTELAIPYRQNANEGLFADNAAARKVHVDAGTYRLVYKLVSGTVTKGGTVYRTNDDFGDKNVVAAFILRSDASSQGYTLIKTNTTAEVDLPDGEIGIQILYCYSGCTFDNAVFELYLEKVEAAEESAETKTLETEIELLCGQYTAENLFRQGGYSRSGSPLSTSYGHYYLVTIDFVADNIIKLKASGDYYLTLMAWDAATGTFAGFRNKEYAFTTDATDEVYWTQELWLSKFKELYPELDFKVEITTGTMIDGTSTNIVPAEASNILTYDISAGTGVKGQYAEELSNTITSVRDAITEPALVFPLVTDIHYKSVNNYFDDCVDNIKAFAEVVRCDFILNLGDDTDGNQTQEITLARAHYMRERFNEIDAPYYHAIGNHDTNYYQSHPKLSSNQIYSAYLSNTRGVYFDLTPGEKNFYKDFDELGIRLIVLDGNHNAAYAFSANTAAWLTNTALNTDYIVVIGVHFSPIAEQNWASKSMINAPEVAAAIQSFVIAGGTVIQFCGHSHADYSFSSPWLSIHCDCQKFEKVDTTGDGYAHLRENADSFNAPTREIGTATEDCWNVVVIKPISRTVDVIRFGAGNDRTFSF